METEEQQKIGDQNEHLSYQPDMLYTQSMNEVHENVKKTLRHNMKKWQQCKSWEKVDAVFKKNISVVWTRSALLFEN